MSDEKLQHINAWVASDSIAMSFQSVKQYRTALMGYIDAVIRGGYLLPTTIDEHLAKNKEYIAKTREIAEGAKTTEADQSLTPDEIAFLREFIAGQTDYFDK